MNKLAKLHQLTDKIPGQIYLWFAIIIFGASSAVTRKLTEIGSQNFLDGRNPISLCNVLFVGNLCALLVFIPIYGRQWNRSTLKQISNQQWLNLAIVAVLSGALVPGLVFQALALTEVNNIILISQLELPLTLFLSVCILRERVDFWGILGAIAASIGVILTIYLQPQNLNLIQAGKFEIGLGELLAAIGSIVATFAAIFSKNKLSQIPIGIYSIFRTTLGTIVFFFVALILYGRDHFNDIFSPFLWKWMLVYGGIIVVLGQSFWIKGIKESKISTASIIGSFSPIAGMMAAYLILDETPTKAQYIGGSLILIGIFLSQISIWRRIIFESKKTKEISLQTKQVIESKMGFKGI